MGQFSLPNTGMYATTCGFAGEKPAGRVLIEKLIIERDIETISNRLDAISSVDKAYAFEALVRLDNSEEFDFSAEIQLQLKRLKGDQTMISTCLGCLQSQESLSSIIKNIITEYGEGNE